jgi:hypothetical protein
MTLDDVENDPVFSAVAKLKVHDVNQRRADALRRRCHALLEAWARQSPSAAMTQPTLIRRSLAPTVVVVWCLVYLLEIIHRAAAVYGS